MEKGDLLARARDGKRFRCVEPDLWSEIIAVDDSGERYRVKAGYRDYFSAEGEPFRFLGEKYFSALTLTPKPAK